MLNHLRNLGYPLSNLVHSVMLNLYTDLMTKDQWFAIFDTLVTYPEYPELFLVLLVAELIN